MEIRRAVLGDLDHIMDIYRYARAYMAQTGNPTQWGDSYPERSMLENDIHIGRLYVCEDETGIQAVFMFTVGEDPTYSIIEDGSWKNDLPYGTIHRLAGSGKIKGVSKACIDFCKEHIPNVRADTHRDNRIMQRVLEANGFEKCGTIYVGDGSSRIAYQFVGN
jgi:RimJ/RimL family protein N-acetyltransferase